MAIPDFQTLMMPVLRKMTDEPQRLADLVPVLANDFALTDEELGATLKNGRTGLFYSRVHWARTYLGKAGLVASPKRGWHMFTNRGREILAAGHDHIDLQLLDSDETFRRWRTASREMPDAPAGRAPRPDDGQMPEILAPTPEEMLAKAHAEITSRLSEELLQAVLALRPVAFEQLILNLLNAMGYGGGHLDSSVLTPMSGDGGIDGVISEDALGLDAIYVQAKRYALDRTISRPALQQFVGSLQGERAGKGVFVTTSSFSRDASAYLERVEPRVVLIDGARLTQLMIRHGVGLRERTKFILHAIDEDYSAEMPG